MYLKQPNTAGHSKSGKRDKCIGKGREKKEFILYTRSIQLSISLFIIVAYVFLIFSLSWVYNLQYLQETWVYIILSLNCSFCLPFCTIESSNLKGRKSVWF